ncbi:hypothetical protein DENSPDRAFT_840636 [Dentipellis sp. KUC8613]|nr:hypothetical protein DENSPDRAFT_840636 [Dentipellis sp. KUC8613]
MSAIDLHNTLFSPEPTFQPRLVPERHGSHTRQQSSLSTTTLQTTTSRHSHPTEPLLHSSSFDSYAYQDLLSRQPLHPDGPRAGWDLGLNLDGDPVTSREKKGYWEKITRKRLRRLRTIKGVLELLIGAWALYTTVRYFVAYVIYSAADRQIVALSLGISSLVSFTCLLLFSLRSVVPFHLFFNQDFQKLRRIQALGRIVTPYLISFFLIAPAIINLVLVFIWRRTSVADLGLQGRCHWDLDVVWRSVGGQCTTSVPAWGVWLAAAIARLIVTAVVLIIFHAACYYYDVTRWPTTPPLAHFRRGSTQKEVSSIMQTRTPSSHTLATSVTNSNNPRLSAPSVHSLALHRVSIASQAPRDPSNRQSVIRPHSFLSVRTAVIPDFRDVHSAVNQSAPSLGRSSGQTMAGYTTETSTTSEDESTESGGKSRSLRRVRSLYDMQGSSSHGHSQHSSAESPDDEAKKPIGIADEDLQGFADRFRTLVGQISREAPYTDSPEASPVTPPLHHVLETHQSYLTIDEFGRAVPTEEHIQVLGGVVRRMPTIESVGSREHTNSSSSRPAASSLASSRPPTRATMLSLSTSDLSQPPSRSNSLKTPASPVRPRTGSAASEGAEQGLREGANIGSGASRPSARSIATSYYTAPNGVSSTSSRGAGDTMSPPRSRSNSLGASEVLAPVTELGELTREEAASERRASLEASEYFAMAMAASGSTSTKANTFGVEDSPREPWDRTFVSEMGQLLDGSLGSRPSGAASPRSPTTFRSASSVQTGSSSAGSFGKP